MAVSTTSSWRRFQLGMRADVPDPVAHFDTVHRVHGIKLEELSDAERAEYEEEREAYARCWRGLQEPEKRERLRRYHEVTDQWVRSEVRAGPWAERVPLSFLRAAGLERPLRDVSRRPRAREVGRGRRVAGGSRDRDGPSGQDEDDPHDIARRRGGTAR
jgi:hypothetical protein